MSKGRNSTNLRALAPGMTWVFQGTVAEDATAGTHVCNLVVTPGAGNEFQVLCGRIVNGNTATLQTMTAFIDDGTNNLATYISAGDTSALVQRNFPSNTALAANTNQFLGTVDASKAIVSGTMRLVLQVTTAAVSVTQTFSVVCRVYGNTPTATLADTVGTPTLTTNTNAFF